MTPCDAGELPISSVASIQSQVSRILGVSEVLSAVQFFTFRVLGLTHTCCGPQGDDPTWSTEDTAELHDEERYLVERLNNLMDDFHTHLDVLVRQSQPEQIADILAGFWTGFWSDRITEETRRLENETITEEERHRSEDIGVVWQANEDTEEEPDNEPDKGKDGHMDDEAGYLDCIRRIDKIFYEAWD